MAGGLAQLVEAIPKPTTMSLPPRSYANVASTQGKSTWCYNCGESGHIRIAIGDSTLPLNVTCVTGLDISRNSVTITSRNSASGEILIIPILSDTKLQKKLCVL